MGLLGKLFGSNSDQEGDKDKKALPWQELKQVDQLDTIQKESSSKTQAIFKHSTRCGISKMALRNFEGSFDLDEKQVDLFYLDLLNHRDISDEISAKFQVLHASPQFLVIRNGEVVHHSSHGEISPQVLHQHV